MRSSFSQPVGPKSNTERQREFRERNPGYYGRLHRKRRAASRAGSAAENRVPPAALMLPAPTIDPLTSEIAKWGAMAESLKSREHAE